MPHVRFDLQHLQAKQGGKAPTGWRSGLVSGSIENRGDVVDAENAGKAAADRGEGSGDEKTSVVCTLSNQDSFVAHQVVGRSQHAQKSHRLYGA